MKCWELEWFCYNNIEKTENTMSSFISICKRPISQDGIITQRKFGPKRSKEKKRKEVEERHHPLLSDPASLSHNSLEKKFQFRKVFLN